MSKLIKALKEAKISLRIKGVSSAWVIKLNPNLFKQEA